MTASEGSLRGRRIVLAEDDCHIAEEIVQALADEEVEVVGPLSTLAEARALAMEEARIDGALLDVNLGGDDLACRGCAPEPERPSVADTWLWCVRYSG